MNIQVSPPGQQKPRRAALIKMRRREQQFLPGALEILETPPAPMAGAMIGTIALFFVFAVTWASFGRIDIIAAAKGKIQPNGHVKTIQSSEAGRVLKASVENGAHVHAGEILIELDPREALAEEGAITADLESFQAEARRRHAAIKAASSGRFDVAPEIAWPTTVPMDLRKREERVLDADLTRLGAEMALFSAQARQKEAERRKLVSTIAAQQNLIATLQERVDMRAALGGTNAFSKSNLLDATEILRTQQATLAQETGQIAELDANLEVIGRDGLKTLRIFVADNAAKLDEAERQVATLTEKRAHEKAKVEHTVIQSPIDGIVQSSIMTTVGQVLSPGEELMRVVPDDAPLEIESYLDNKDIAFVAEGQRAVVKITSIPFTRYGTVDAIVTRVARDAIPQPEASQAEQDPSHDGHGAMAGGADRVQNLVYAVTLRPLQTGIDVDGTIVPLGSGMEVTTEIRTGSRRIIDYVLSPLRQTGSEALRER